MIEPRRSSLMAFHLTQLTLTQASPRVQSLALHYSSTSLMTYQKDLNPMSACLQTTRSCILQHVKSAKYLVCATHDQLDWGEHINNTCNRNVSTVWDPHKKGDINKLEMANAWGARYVKNRYHNRSSVTGMITDLNWRSLHDRRKDASSIMFYNIVNNIVAISHTRIQAKSKSDPNSDIHYFHIPFCRILYRQTSFFARTVREWNSLPAYTLSAQYVDAFNAQLTKHYI